MQHRKVARHIDIVLLHADNLYGKGYFLPKGDLRDSPKRLVDMDYIIINHVKNEEHCDRIMSSLIKWLDVPMIGTKMQPLCIKLVNGKEICNIHGLRIGVFCALGMPDSFVNTLKEAGAEVNSVWKLLDHSAPTAAQLDAFAKKCVKQGCDLIVCSYKDWVKLSKEIMPSSLPCGFLDAYMEIVKGKDVYNDLLTKVYKLNKKIEKKYYEAVD